MFKTIQSYAKITRYCRSMLSLIVSRVTFKNNAFNVTADIEVLSFSSLRGSKSPIPFTSAFQFLSQFNMTGVIMSQEYTFKYCLTFLLYLY